MNSPHIIGTIYMVDDDNLHRGALKKLFVTSGYSVRDFEFADEFLALKEISHPCTLILDMRMPVKNGLEVQAELAQSNKQMPVIFLSGQSYTEEVIASFKNGAFDFILKPFDSDALLSSVSKALDLDKQSQMSNTHKQEVRKFFSELTDREREVYELLNQGLLNTEIAEILTISPRTVKAHKAQIMGKMHSDSPQDLLIKWQQVHDLS